VKVEAGERRTRQLAAAWRSGERHWHLGGTGALSALQLAEKLLALEILTDLRYRGVEVKADAVDVTPCHETHGVKSYRFFVLRPADCPAAPPPAGEVPREWRSEVLILPSEGEGLMGRMAPFEAEFAVRSFLRHVEREIDGLLGRMGR
jgi:hypothetical protein